jgi:hypothetical protein
MAFAEIWPEYVRAHSRAEPRVMHCVGTLLGWGLLVGALALQRWWWSGFQEAMK